MSDMRMPDFSVPALTSTDFTRPQLDMPDVTQPDPPLADLLSPLIPSDVDMPINVIPTSPDYELALPANAIGELPAELSSSVASLIQDSADYQQLPQNVQYDNLNMIDDLTTRNRHLGMLLLGLEGDIEVQHEADSH